MNETQIVVAPIPTQVVEVIELRRQLSFSLTNNDRQMSFKHLTD